MDKPSFRQKKSLVSDKIIDLLNQVFEIEKKANRISDDNSINRHIQKIKDLFEDEFFGEAELIYKNPIGEEYNETRTDCEASIAGESAENLVITEVIKPIIRIKKGGVTRIAQKGVVIVESQDQQSTDE